MTFDDSYEKYKAAREEVRVTHGALSKKLGEREQIDKELRQLIKTYKRLHRNLEAAQLALIPELDKEVAAHTKPAKIKEIVDRVLGSGEIEKAMASEAPSNAVPAETEDNPAEPAD